MIPYTVYKHRNISIGWPVCWAGFATVDNKLTSGEQNSPLILETEMDRQRYSVPHKIFASVILTDCSYGYTYLNLGVCFSLKYVPTIFNCICDQFPRRWCPGVDKTDWIKCDRKADNCCCTVINTSYFLFKMSLKWKIVSLHFFRSPDINCFKTSKKLMMSSTGTY